MKTKIKMMSMLAVTLVAPSAFAITDVIHNVRVISVSVTAKHVPFPVSFGVTPRTVDDTSEMLFCSGQDAATQGILVSMLVAAKTSGQELTVERERSPGRSRSEGCVSGLSLNSGE